ncbi:hypothetical protein BUALT_Bualt16G0048400 [Buddleja alternifolia]|uniref:Myb/SANT-like domain-containing protein n=1 Tax=Buddleja alternifolia TaxID=168488 RepID=A0AAV6WEJ7_9LAMI|nr:hypothetical protein BUALT_Bualt16G0048400 [Buddleja alternifolia]
MDSNSNMVRSSTARNKTKSTKRSWSYEEELVLVSALKEVVSENFGENNLCIQPFLYIDKISNMALCFSSQTDINARTMRYKSWLLYNDWCEVFGKD